MLAERQPSDGVRTEPADATRSFLVGGRGSVIAVLATIGIAVHLALRWGGEVSPAVRELPLYLVLTLGGVQLVVSLVRKLVRRQFGSDLLAGISIVAAALLALAAPAHAATIELRAGPVSLAPGQFARTLVSNAGTSPCRCRAEVRRGAVQEDGFVQLPGRRARSACRAAWRGWASATPRSCPSWSRPRSRSSAAA